MIFNTDNDTIPGFPSRCQKTGLLRKAWPLLGTVEEMLVGKNCNFRRKFIVILILDFLRLGLENKKIYRP